MRPYPISADTPEAVKARVERYTESISAHLSETTDRWSFQQYRPAASADTTSAVEAALGAIPVADAEQAELRAEIERLTSELGLLVGAIKYQGSHVYADVADTLRRGIVTPAEVDPDLFSKAAR